MDIRLESEHDRVTRDVARGSSDAGAPATLTSHDYCSHEAYELERRGIFHRGWMYVCHLDSIAPGTRRAFDLAGESVLVTRGVDGTLHAFANVCRHRGAELCSSHTSEATRGSIRCNYHAWTYGLDGALLATPRVDDIDRDQHGLWRRHVEQWNGLVFVSVADSPPPLLDWLAEFTQIHVDFAHLPVATYCIGARTEAIVQSNWKILIENYNECLHCAVVHPELVDLIPIYRTGHVVDPERDDEVVGFRPGAAAFTLDGTSTAAVLPGVPATPEYSGLAIFPNVMFDLTPTSLALTALFPIAPGQTRVVAEYLFDPASIERPDFDPAHEIALDELVGAQDYAVCEMVQRGVTSRAFVSGALTSKDAYVAEFVARYRRAIAGATSALDSARIAASD